MRIRQHIGKVDIQLDTKRLDRNMMEAQKRLNMAVRIDCEPLVPFLNGGLKKSFGFGNGDVHSDFVEWTAPYAHYLYEGRVYGPNIPIIDEITGEITGWWSPKEKHPTKKKIQYHEPGTTDHWFEKAKERHGDEWLKLVREEAGKG